MQKTRGREIDEVLRTEDSLRAKARRAGISSGDIDAALNTYADALNAGDRSKPSEFFAKVRALMWAGGNREGKRPNGLLKVNLRDVADLKSNRRILNCALRALFSGGITTVERLAGSTDSDMLKCKGCGRKSFHEVNAWLEGLGISRLRVKSILPRPVHTDLPPSDSMPKLSQTPSVPVGLPLYPPTSELMALLVNYMPQLMAAVRQAVREVLEQHSGLTLR